MQRAGEARRRPGEPGQPVRGHASQHRLDGARPARRPGPGVRPRARGRSEEAGREPGRRAPARSGRGRERDASSVLEIRTGGLELVLAKPQTYMNESGRAVRRLLQSYLVPISDLLVVADDFALPFGKLRFREAGSHGGHNGLRSIIDELGTEKFSRLRVGIGEPGRGAVDHVLSRFQPDERQRLGTLLDAAADGVEAWAHEGTAKAANRFNSWDLQAPPDDDEHPPAGEVGGPPDGQGIRRTRTGWRKVLPG